MRIFLIIVGSVSLVLGILGIFLPMLPTTPFLLLSAAAWVKASPSLYEWLINHKVFGEYIRNFREYRAIPLRVKIISVSLVWLTIGYCIFAVVDEWWWAQALMALLATAISWHILSFKTLKKKN
ncbi:MAG: YbaN family protein [Alistipes sp.]|nr:YbaN family protein [Alistipes sp.]